MHCVNLGPVHTTHVMSCSTLSKTPAEPCSEVQRPSAPVLGLFFVEWHSLSHKQEVVWVQASLGTAVDSARSPCLDSLVSCCSFKSSAGKMKLVFMGFHCRHLQVKWSPTSHQLMFLLTSLRPLSNIIITSCTSLFFYYYYYYSHVFTRLPWRAQRELNILRGGKTLYISR